VIQQCLHCPVATAVTNVEELHTCATCNVPQQTKTRTRVGLQGSSSMCCGAPSPCVLAGRDTSLAEADG
jgi:hypothetical protein